MGTDWLVKARCPKPERNLSNEEGHIKTCSSCPYVIWEKPESVAGFMHTMCGVRVGDECQDIVHRKKCHDIVQSKL